MLNNLYNLIFGTREYSRNKIEDRFIEANSILPKVKISNLDDFELIERVIYKLKEDLRVPSSNLSRVIRNSSRQLKKKEVLEFIDKLEEIKYEFLRQLYSKSISEESLGDVSSYKQKDFKEEREEINVSKNLNSSNEGKEEITLSENDDGEKSQNNLILEDNEKYVSIEGGEVPYIYADFRGEIDYVLLRDLSKYFFDTYNCEGTNIIVENSKALIIPRHSNDNLLNLNRKKLDIDEISKSLDETKLKKSSDYFYLDKKKPEYETTKDEERSLEEKVQEHQEKYLDYNTSHNDSTQNQNLEIEKGDYINVEKEKGISSEINLEEYPFKEENQGDEEGITIYSDDKILIYLREYTKVPGELVIKDINSRNLNELDEGDLAYIFIFAKAFSSILFEASEAEGTNILYDFSSNKIVIIPRNQDDNVGGLTTSRNESDDSFLEQVKDKLLSKMSQLLGETPQEQKENTKESKEVAEKEQKAKYLLDSLKRIP